MNINQINSLTTPGKLPGSDEHSELVQTHISWVILFPDVVYKIKRPVKYSFVDFSTLEKRHYYCQQEIELNKRLAPDMYLDVIPITSRMTGEDKDDSRIVDYAVKMKRMDNSKEMDRLLELKMVTKHNAESLAKVIADFHRNIEVIYKPFTISHFQALFADLESVESFTRENAGKKYASIIDKSIIQSDEFLRKYSKTFYERVKQGFFKNCHGDINTFNVFLYEDPVIFDCIDFNEDFRHIDVLNEIAFLCVDLDFYNQHPLSDHFIRKYFEYSELEKTQETQRLLAYYKSYRANIRAKVNLISARDSKQTPKNHKVENACKYLYLMEKYINEASSGTQ
jgi:aminoglycoside phosphotransferase family enzyme